MIKTIAIAAGILAAVLIVEIIRNRKIRFRMVNFLSTDPEVSDRENVLRILHISDIHLTGSTLYRLKAFEAVRDKEWDFIFTTGDLIDENSGIQPLAEALAGLKAGYGKYSVLGNHDYMHFHPQNLYQWLRIVLGALIKGRSYDFCSMNDINRLISAMEKCGFPVLRNEVRAGVMADGTGYQVFGIDDPTLDKDDPSSLYHCLDNKAAFRVVLLHSPHRLGALRPLRPDLVLCGHTHGGQIRIPFLGALTTGSDAERKNPAGMVVLEGLRVHISPGMGAGRVVPFRILAPPEITGILVEKRTSAQALREKRT